DGKILVGGAFLESSDTTLPGIIRLNSDGSIDQSFTAPSSVTGVSTFAVQADGKVFVANQNFGAPSEAYVVERYNVDGSLDTIFPKKYVNREVKDLIIQTDGNITFVGYFDYNPTGIM